MKQSEFPLIKTKKDQKNLIYTKGQTKSQSSPKKEFESTNSSRNVHTYIKLNSSNEFKSKQSFNSLSDENNLLVLIRTINGYKSLVLDYQKQTDLLSKQLSQKDPKLYDLEIQLLQTEEKLKQEMIIKEKADLRHKKIKIMDEIRQITNEIDKLSYKKRDLLSKRLIQTDVKLYDLEILLVQTEEKLNQEITNKERLDLNLKKKLITAQIKKLNYKNGDFLFKELSQAKNKLQSFKNQLLKIEEKLNQEITNKEQLHLNLKKKLIMIQIIKLSQKTLQLNQSLKEEQKKQEFVQWVLANAAQQINKQMKQRKTKSRLQIEEQRILKEIYDY